MRKLMTGMLLTIGLWPPTDRAETSNWPINVVVDLTDAGKKVSLPQPGKPVYYYPIVAGYKEKGSLVAGQTPPPQKDVIKQLAVALAQQNYLVVSSKTPAPSLLLIFHWGYMNPMIDEMGSPGDSQKVFFNQKEMFDLVAGHTYGALDLSYERADVMDAAEKDRYFVVVLAFDFEAAQKHEKKLLWSAKMSAPSLGTSMSEIVPALIAAGVPQFGKETKRPLRISMPLNNKPKVELGPTEVKEYVDPTTAPSLEKKSDKTRP